MTEVTSTETPIVEELTKTESKTEETVKADSKSEEKSEDKTKTESKAADLDRAAKIEKFQREQRQKIEAEKLRIEAEKAELAEYKKIKQLKSENPIKVLEALGLSVDDIVKSANNPKTTDPVAERALAEVERIKAELQEEKDRIHRDQLAKVEQELTHNIETAVKDGGYDLISELGFIGSVRQYMEEHYSKTGEILDPKDAAKEVNDIIATNIKKVMKSKWLSTEEKIEAIQEIKEDVVPTLTNSMNSESPKTKKPMTEAERLAAAVALLK